MLMCCYGRYSAFIVLYPPGLISEAWLVFLALIEGTDVGLLYRMYLLLGFLTYIPGESKLDIRECYMADSRCSELHYVFAYAVSAKTYVKAHRVYVVELKIGKSSLIESQLYSFCCLLSSVFCLLSSILYSLSIVRVISVLIKDK